MKPIRPTRVLPSLLAIGLLPAGCVEIVEPDALLSETLAEDELREGELPDDFDVVCTGERMLARSTAPDSCPVVDGWTQTSLLEDGSPWLANHTVSAPDPQGHLCAYTWISAGPGSMPLSDATDALEAELVSPASLHTLAPDCDIVLGQRTSVISDAIAPAMSQRFHDQIGWVSGATLPGGRQPVAVAVIDTMPKDPGQMTDPPRSEHGEHMARIIDDVACPPGAACNGFAIDRVLGMPRWANGVDYQRGGYVGSFGDLAAAIAESVERWRDDYTSPRPPLILNLSVGWEPEWGPSEVEVSAVKTALEYASCAGALIIASAGNQNALCAFGPMYPAAWEDVPAPSAARCADLGFTPAAPAVGYQPLVHAVGGLDVDGSAMPGTRMGSMPRLVATATHAVASNPYITATLTGSSVAAAVVSGAAALVWSYDPALLPHEVMQLLYDSGPVAQGDGIPAAAEVGLAAPPIRRLDVCEALEHACSQNPSCPGMDLGCAPGAAGPADFGDVVSAVETLAGVYVQPKDIVTRSFDQPQTCAGQCGGTVDGWEAVGGDVCGAIELEPTAHLVAPQPYLPPCPNCVLTSDEDPASGTAVNWHVLASLDSSYEDQDIRQVIVTVDDGVSETSFDFGAVPLSVDDITRLVLDDSRMPTSIDQIQRASVSVEFDTAEAWAMSNPLLYDSEN